MAEDAEREEDEEPPLQHVGVDDLEAEGAVQQLGEAELQPAALLVVHVLEAIFGHNRENATRIMLNVHKTGKGVCGIYTRDIAETKVTSVNSYARENKHPLLCDMEEN